MLHADVIENVEPFIIVLLVLGDLFPPDFIGFIDPPFQAGGDIVVSFRFPADRGTLDAGA
jgi:hypothetical protein